MMLPTFLGSLPEEILHSADRNLAARALARPGPLAIQDVAALLSQAALPFLEAMGQKARAATRARFGRAVQMFAPLYLSNECVNICHYCGFSVDNAIRRRTLSPDEVAREWEHLHREGFRHVLLVSGEENRRVSVDYLSAVVRMLRPRAASIAIEVAPLEERDYRACVASGVDGVVIYQETYDTVRYTEVHPKGPKRDFTYRWEALERAARAGARKLGMGVLLGLSDWRRDVLALVAHVRAMEKLAWQSEISVSVPRLRPAAGEYVPPVAVSDRDLAQIVIVLRLSLPNAPIVLSTREPAPLRDRLVPLGVTQMSAGSRTNPGGYALGKDETGEAEPQFEVSDRRSPAEVVSRLAAMGYEPVWKDWDMAFGRVMSHES